MEGIGGAGGAWLIAALALGLAELAVPGVFLIFLAIAAAVTGAIVFAVPALPVGAQLGAFALWAVLAVLIGRRWYRDYPVDTADALLNDRAGRLVGQAAIVTTAIEQGRGRVRIGDGDWPAAGVDAPVGLMVRIVRVEGGVVVVEADTASSPRP